jgi:hypothetical protein
MKISAKKIVVFVTNAIYFWLENLIKPVPEPPGKIRISNNHDRDRIKSILKMNQIFVLVLLLLIRYQRQSQSSSFELTKSFTFKLPTKNAFFFAFI